MKSKADKFEQAYKQAEHKRNEEVESLTADISICNSKQKEAIQKSIM
jgi:hypothetical protein